MVSMAFFDGKWYDMKKGGRMMKIKKLIVLLLAACLVIPQASMVKAAEIYPNLDEKVTVKSYSGDTYKVFEAPDSEDGYALSSAGRNLDQTIVLPSDKVMVLQNSGEKAYTNLSAVLEESSGTNYNKDIKLRLSSKQLNRGQTLNITINFADKNVEPCLNRTAILLKEGNDVVKRIPFSYDTTGYRDEHNVSVSQWSGSYYYLSGVGTTRNIGTIDYAQSIKNLRVTYKNSGTAPVLKFVLDPSGYFTFSNGKYEYYGSGSANKVGGTNTLNLVVKSKFKSDFYKLAAAGGLDYVNSSKAAAMLSELQVVYNDAFDADGRPVPGVTLDSLGGCIEGGATSMIPLTYYISMKPLGTIKTKTSSRKTSSVKVSWNKLNGVSGYRIYRSTKKNSGYKYLKQLSSKTTSFTNKKLKSGKTYYYKVRAYSNVFGDRYYGSYSAPLKSGTRPAKPKVTVKRSGRRLKIKYKKISGASGYRIYIRTGKKGKYKRVKQYTSGKKVSYTSKKLKKKKTYYVKVRAYKTINGKKYFGSYSKAKKIKIR